MQKIELRDVASDSRLVVDPEHGFNALEFITVVKGTAYNLLYKEGAPILFPYANRILLNDYGEIEWYDSSGTLWKSQLLRDELVNAGYVRVNDFKKSVMHGFAQYLPFTVTGSGENFVTGLIKFSDFPILPPFYCGLEFEVTHRLERNNWSTTAVAKNTNDHEIPIAYCVHYWFNAVISGHVKRENCVVTLPAGKRWEAENKFPTGTLFDVSERFDFREGRKIGRDEFYDDVFLRSENGKSYQVAIQIPEEKVKIVVSAPSVFRNIVFYVPESKPETICIEPQTSSVDMFNMEQRGIDGANVITLSPAEERVFETNVGLVTS